MKTLQEPSSDRENRCLVVWRLGSDKEGRVACLSDLACPLYVGAQGSEGTRAGFL